MQIVETTFSVDFLKKFSKVADRKEDGKYTMEELAKTINAAAWQQRKKMVNKSFLFALQNAAREYVLKDKYVKTFAIMENEFQYEETERLYFFIGKIMEEKRYTKSEVYLRCEYINAKDRQQNAYIAVPSDRYPGEDNGEEKIITALIRRKEKKGKPASYNRYTKKNYSMKESAQPNGTGYKNTALYFSVQNVLPQGLYYENRKEQELFASLIDSEVDFFRPIGLIEGYPYQPLIVIHTKEQDILVEDKDRMAGVEEMKAHKDAFCHMSHRYRQIFV